MGPIYLSKINTGENTNYTSQASQQSGHRNRVRISKSHLQPTEPRDLPELSWDATGGYLASVFELS